MIKLKIWSSFCNFILGIWISNKDYKIFLQELPLYGVIFFIPFSQKFSIQNRVRKLRM